MLEVEVDKRYTALQVLEHPWVTVSTVSVNLFICFVFTKTLNLLPFSSFV